MAYAPVAPRRRPRTRRTATAATAFTLFPHLPPELRIIIWCRAADAHISLVEDRDPAVHLAGPTGVNTNINPHSQQQQGNAAAGSTPVLPVGIATFHGSSRIPCMTVTLPAIPSVMHTCRESRAAVGAYLVRLGFMTQFKLKLPQQIQQQQQMQHQQHLQQQIQQQIQEQQLQLQLQLQIQQQHIQHNIQQQQVGLVSAPPNTVLTIVPAPRVIAPQPSGMDMIPIFPPSSFSPVPLPMAQSMPLEEEAPPDDPNAAVDDGAITFPLFLPVRPYNEAQDALWVPEEAMAAFQQLIRTHDLRERGVLATKGRVKPAADGDRVWRLYLDLNARETWDTNFWRGLDGCGDWIRDLVVVTGRVKRR